MDGWSSVLLWKYTRSRKVPRQVRKQIQRGQVRGARRRLPQGNQLRCPPREKMRSLSPGSKTSAECEASGAALSSVRRPEKPFQFGATDPSKINPENARHERQQYDTSHDCQHQNRVHGGGSPPLGRCPTSPAERSCRRTSRSKKRAPCEMRIGVGVQTLRQSIDFGASIAHADSCASAATPTGIWKGISMKTKKLLVAAVLAIAIGAPIAMFVMDTAVSDRCCSFRYPSPSLVWRSKGFLMAAPAASRVRPGRGPSLPG